MNEEMISSKDVCSILGVTRMTLYRYIKKGLIKPVYYSVRKIKFDKSEILDFARHGLTQEVQN